MTASHPGASPTIPSGRSFLSYKRERGAEGPRAGTAPYRRSAKILGAPPPLVSGASFCKGEKLVGRRMVFRARATKAGSVSG